MQQLQHWQCSSSSIDPAASCSSIMLPLMWPAVGVLCCRGRLRSGSWIRLGLGGSLGQ